MKQIELLFVLYCLLVLPIGPGSRVLGRTGLVLAWGAKGPGPDRLGFGWGAKGPGPDRLGFGLGGPRVPGRAGLVLNI